MKKLRKRIKKIDRRIRYSFCSILLIVMIIISFFSVRTYLNYIDKKCSELSENHDIIYDVNNLALGSNGFYVFNVTEYIENNIKSDDTVIKLQFKKGNFTIYLNKGNISEEKQYYNLSKIVDAYHNVNAQLNMTNLETIEFMTGNLNNELVIKFNMINSKEYLAVIPNKYYLLGEDIESISYMDEHFFYVSYNPKYKALYDAPNCDQAIIDQIENFKYSDIYYSYGKINFMDSFYQKLSSQEYTVQNRCDELAK